MPLTDVGRPTFFGDPRLDHELPKVNEAFWSALIEHVERDLDSHPRVILDIGCHTGGLLEALSRRFSPTELIGIEPIAAVRAVASDRLEDAALSVSILDVSEWDLVPTSMVDLIVSHEMLYLVPDLASFMRRIQSALAPVGVAYVILGGHIENPLWQTWKEQLIADGHRVYDHGPIGIMEAAASVGLLPAVQPLRRSGWVTYDPLQADFHYTSVQKMLDHHYRHKLIFRLQLKDGGANSP